MVVSDSYRRLLSEAEDVDEDMRMRRCSWILSGVRGYKIKTVKFETQFIFVDI